MKVLVVEDQPIELKLADHVLSAAGFRVTGAHAAPEAFAAIERDRPQLILVDLNLPGMDGLDIARRLRSDHDTRTIPIVAITSYPELFSRSAALAAGCNEYILKPVSTRLLPTFLWAVLDEPRGAL